MTHITGKQHRKINVYELTFKKTAAEKKALKAAKLNWNAAMKALHPDFVKRNTFGRKFSQSGVDTVKFTPVVIN